MRVLFFGDSITQGFWDIEGGWVERVRKHYDGLSIKDLENNLQPEVFNLGISGDTTRSLLLRVESETKVRKWEDDALVVVIAIGTNDDLFESDKQWVSPEEFRSNLEQLVGILKPLANTTMFIGNPACDELRTKPVSWGDFSYSNRELQRSEQVMQEVAGKYELTFVPIFEEFKARLDAGNKLLTDGLHPNDEGHQFIADRVLPSLDSVISQIKNLTT